LLAAGLGYGFGTHHFAQILAIRASPQNPLRNGATLHAISTPQDNTERRNTPPRKNGKKKMGFFKNENNRDKTHYFKVFSWAQTSNYRPMINNITDI
jgi:hypothetical protein